MEMLARGVLLATIGFLASSFFLSDGIDKRLWVLFGLGPAMLAVASKRPGKALEPGPSWTRP